MTSQHIVVIPRRSSWQKGRAARAGVALAVVLLAALAPVDGARAACGRVDVGEHWVEVVPGHLPGTLALVVGGAGTILLRRTLGTIAPRIRCVRLHGWLAERGRLFIGIELSGVPGGDVEMVYRYRLHDGHFRFVRSTSLEGRSWI